jgi:hypothetical protein
MFTFGQFVRNNRNGQKIGLLHIYLYICFCILILPKKHCTTFLALFSQTNRATLFTMPIFATVCGGCKYSVRSMVARFFLVPHTRTGENKPEDKEMYKTATQYLYQMFITYTK